MYIRCMYGILSRKFTHTYCHKQCAYTVMANPIHVQARELFTIEPQQGIVDPNKDASVHVSVGVGVRV